MAFVVDSFFGNQVFIGGGERKRKANGTPATRQEQRRWTVDTLKRLIRSDRKNDMEDIVAKQKVDFADRFFGVSQSRLSTKMEVPAGITMFIIVAYILILNPQILSDPCVIMGDPVMAEKVANGVFIGTYIGALIETMFCVLYAKVPFAQAPGVGLNAFFVYTVILGMRYTYGQVLAIVFLSGIFFIVIIAVDLREAIIRSTSDVVKVVITPGIGLFITITGLKNVSIIVSNPATLIGLVDFSQWKLEGADMMLINGALTALTGLITMGILHARKAKGSILLGIAAATPIGIPPDITHLSSLDMNTRVKFRDFAEVSFVRMDFAGLFVGTNFMEAVFTVTTLVISFSLVNMFGSIRTLPGTARQSGMIDEDGEVIRTKRALMLDAASTLAGAMVGTSTAMTVVEFSAGIAVRGRTGLTSLVTAFIFLRSVLFVLTVNAVLTVATASVLIFVGILISGSIREVDFSEMSNILPAFCTIVFVPFTYPVANSVASSLVTCYLMKLIANRRWDVKALTLVVSVVSVVRYASMTLG